MHSRNELQAVEKQAKRITAVINSIQNELTEPAEAMKSNRKNSVLLKIPKYLILTRIAPFLTNRQCNYLSSTCINMRRCIYSPLGWKVLTYSHSPYPLAISDSEFSTNSLKRNCSFTSSELEENIEDYEDEEYLLRERGKFKEVLWTRYKQKLSAQEKSEVLAEKVRSQKIFLFKRGLKKEFFQNITRDLQKQNQKYKQSLKKITQDFTIKYEKLQSETIAIQQENSKLQKQKQALVGKIKEYQRSMPALDKETENAKEVLRLLKNFAIETEFQELEEVDFDF